MRVNRLSPGNYLTEDGRYEITRVEDYETECDGPHPARMSAENFAMLSDFTKRAIESNRGHHVKMNGTHAYYCEGGETHYYTRWIVWSTEADDYPRDSGPDGFDTYRDAKSFALSLYGKDA